MPCVISGVSIAVDSAAAVVPWGSAKYVYLQPSRDDFLFNRNGGGTWVAWEGDADLEDTYPGAIAVAVNLSTGAWSVTVPFSDSEVQFVGGTGPGTPPLVWNIIDPNVASGEKVYYGPTLASIVSTSKTLQQLLALASPDTWQIASASYTGYPYGAERLASVTFAAGVDTASASWTDIGTTGWKATGSLHSDDSGVTGWQIVGGTETATGCSVRLSGAPAAGKSATVNLWVRP